MAQTEADFAQIARLNHRTFCEELGQHPLQSSGQRTDPRHQANTYLVASRQDQVLAMLAFSSVRPFSLDQHLDVSSFLDAEDQPVEIRLLSVREDQRLSRILPGLLTQLWRVLDPEPWTVLVIKGRCDRFGLYQKLGFLPFGDVIRHGSLEFQPAMLRREGASPFGLQLLERF